MKPIPKLRELYDQFSADLRSRLNLIVIVLKFVCDALAAVWTGQLWLAYLYLQDIQNNIFPDTADPESEGGTLERQGRMHLRRDPFPATEGFYTAAVTGIAGAVLRAGLIYKSNDDSRSPGNLYQLDNEYILTGANDVITLRALSAGKAYQLDAGDGLTATEPLIGAAQVIIIATMTVQPTEAESIEDYREKVLDALQLEPQGGARTDYRLWAADVPGVRKVYPYVKNGDPGTMQIYVEAATEDSTDGKGTPSQATMDAVYDAILFDPDETMADDDRGRIPMGATEEVLPVSLKPVDITITTLQVDTSDIRSQISTALTDFLYKVRPFIDGADLMRNKNDTLTSPKAQSVVTDTIGTANTFLNFSLSVDGVAVSSYKFEQANIPYLRNLIFN